MKNTNVLKFKVNSDYFLSIIEKLEDLTKIEDVVKIKIDSDDIFLYTILGGETVLALKSYLLKTKDYLNFIDTDKGEFNFKIDVVIPNAKRFVKNISSVKNFNNVYLEFFYKNDDTNNNLNVKSLRVISDRIKINWIAGENYEIKDISKNLLESRINTINKKFSFFITQDDFSDIKKFSNINNEKNINIEIRNGVIYFGEKTSWELEVGKISSVNDKLYSLSKKYLSFINNNVDKIEFNIFDKFILIKDELSILMLSFEQDFS